jgi:thermitase
LTGIRAPGFNDENEPIVHPFWNYSGKKLVFLIEIKPEIMSFLYAISFLTSIIALGAWFFSQNRPSLEKPFQKLLFTALGVYLTSVLLAKGAIDYKMGVLFRDFVVIGTSGLVFLYLARLKKVFWIGLAFMIGALALYFRTQTLQTFPMVQKITLHAEGELLVQLKETRRIDALKNILDQFGLEYQRAFYPQDEAITMLDDYFVIDVPKEHTRKLRQIEETLLNSGLVEWVEGNEVIVVENPRPTRRLPEVNRKFGINDPGLEFLWGYEAMEVDKLYAYLRAEKIKPAKKALIAILDTGVDAKHEDLKGNYRSLKSKYDDDPMGHGSHCAGIAAAVSNNGVGVASFSPDNGFVEVTSIKVLSASGMGTQQSIINGIIEAADNGADVISLSLGGRSNQTKENAYRKAVKYANNKGAIVVAAAGNSNRNAKDFAPVNAPGVIGVSAVDEKINRAVFSNYVSDIEMGVAAPGVNIYSTIPASKYASFNGTSMATPYVSGLVGLMKSIRPSLTTKEIYSILSTTGMETKNTNETGKLINPAEAVKKLMNN